MLGIANHLMVVVFLLDLYLSLATKTAEPRTPLRMVPGQWWRQSRARRHVDLLVVEHGGCPLVRFLGHTLVHWMRIRVDLLLVRPRRRCAPLD